MTETVNSQTDNYTYFSNTNRLHEITGANPLTFTYDANGGVTAMGTKTLVFNQDNRLVLVTENEATIGAYTYNGKGERVKKVAGTNTTIYHYDFDGKLIGESTPAGTMLKEYLYTGQIRMAMVDVAPGRISFYLNDRLGTPQMMTDSTGKVVWEGMYKPFGEASVHPRSTVTNNIRFPGQYYDSETGLHYNYQRYYQPNTGRYITPDPIGQAETLNAYLYGHNNPIRFRDVFGLATKGSGFNLTGAILGIGGVLGAQVVTDSKGDIGIAITYGGGGYGDPLQASAQVSAGWTTAESINDLSGVGGIRGVSFSKPLVPFLTLGGETTVGPNYTGGSAATGYGWGLLPVDLYGMWTNTKVVNMSDLIEKLLHDLFGIPLPDDNFYADSCEYRK